MPITACRFLTTGRQQYMVQQSIFVILTILFPILLMTAQLASVQVQALSDDDETDIDVETLRQENIKKWEEVVHDTFEKVRETFSGNRSNSTTTSNDSSSIEPPELPLTGEEITLSNESH